MSIFEVFFLTLLVYTAPQIMVFCAVLGFNFGDHTVLSVRAFHANRDLCGKLILT